MIEWIVLDSHIINANRIENVDISDIENLRVKVKLENIEYEVSGIQAIEFLMQMRPSIFEGHNFRWKRRAWMFHNFVGHPVMQIAALFKQYKLAMWIHDITVPRPIGKRVNQLGKEHRR